MKSSRLDFLLWQTNCCVRPHVLAGVINVRLRCYQATQFVDGISLSRAPRLPATAWTSRLPKTGRPESHRAVVARGVVCWWSTYDNAACVDESGSSGEDRAPVVFPIMICHGVWHDHVRLRGIMRVNFAQVLFSALVFLIPRCGVISSKSWTNWLLGCCLFRRHDET